MGLGRPTKCTPEVRARVCEALSAGNTRSAAAEYAGIGETTFYRWMSEDDPEHREFREAVKKAEAIAEVRNVAIISKAAQDTWQAAAWWLERRKPADWGRRDRVSVDAQVTGKDGGPLVVTREALRSMSDDELATVEAAVAAIERNRGSGGETS
jgi:transposase